MINFLRFGLVVLSVLFTDSSFALSTPEVIADHIRAQCDQTTVVPTIDCLDNVREQIRFFSKRISLASVEASSKRNRSAVSLSLVQDTQTRLTEMSKWVGSDPLLRNILKNTNRELSNISHQLMNWEPNDKKEVTKNFFRLLTLFRLLSRELGV